MDRRRYTREFKIEAVKLVRGGLPFDQVLGLQAQEPSWPTNGFATKLPTPGQHRRHLMYDANMSDDAAYRSRLFHVRPWLPALRATMREDLFSIPLREPVCDGCLMAFWTNVYEACEELDGGSSLAEHSRPRHFK